MANFELKNINIATIPITTVDEAGDTVPAIVGDTWSVVCSDPTKATAVIGATAAGAAALVLTPLVKLGPNLTGTIKDADNLTEYVLTFDIVNDLTPAAVGLDMGNAVLTVQPVPTAA